jgi:hypothetical protein
VAHQKLNRTLKLITRLPAEPPPGPKKEILEPDGDCKKKGEVMFPIGVPLLVRFKMLVALTENVTA